MRCMDYHNTNTAANSCKFNNKEEKIMSTLIGILLSFLVKLGGMFCQAIPPGLPCFLFLGEPDFNEIADCYSDTEQ